MQSTRDKIVTYLANSPNHSVIKRQILMRMSYREDFQATYDAMLADHTIEEYGFGTKSAPRMVALSFQAIQALPKE